MIHNHLFLIKNQSLSRNNNRKVYLILDCYTIFLKYKKKKNKKIKLNEQKKKLYKKNKIEQKYYTTLIKF